MKIWMSAEVQGDVANAYMRNSAIIERAFNASFDGRSFGVGLSELTYLSIIREVDSPDYDEVARYKKRSRSAEFRLKLPYAQCVGADDQILRRLIAGSIGRAIHMLGGMRIADFDWRAFESAYAALCAEQGWLR